MAVVDINKNIFYKLESHYRYKGGGGSRYEYILVLFISTKKWARPGPCYPYSVRITRYVRINFVPIVNQAGGLIIGTVLIAKP